MYPKDYRTGDEFDCEADKKVYEYEDNETGKTVYCPVGPSATKKDQDEFFERKSRNGKGLQGRKSP